MSVGETSIACPRCQADFSADALFCPMCGAPRAKPDMDPLVGEVIASRYLLRERLGQGASGTIYLAEHVTLRRRVAVKILHHELSRDDMAIERFRREATTVAEIDNEHIVEVHDFGRTDDGRLFLAMEHLQGETLADLLSRGGPLSVERCVDILKQLGEALMEAHAMGYIHRDLRPRNVFLARRRGKDGFVKLLDFGLAKLVEAESGAASTSLGMTFGDPHYMSPEQAQGQTVDRRTDIYSLGCIAFEMLAGKPPFSGGRVFDVLTRHLEDPPPRPSSVRADVPPWLDAVVERALAKSPQERFITVYRLVEALDKGRATGEVMSDEAARSMPRITPPPPAPRSREMEPAAEAPHPTAVVKAVESTKGQPGLSGAWYADGEDLEREAEEGGTSEPGQRRAAPLFTGTDVFAAPSPNRRLVLAAAAALGIVALIVILVAAWPRGKDAPEAAAMGASEAAPAAASEDTASTEAPPGEALAVAAKPDAPATKEAAAPKGVGPDDTGASRPPRKKPPRKNGRDRDGDDGLVDVDDDEPSPLADGPPDDPDKVAQARFFVKLGEQALKRGDPVAAATNFNKAREYHPGSADAIAGLGQAAMQQGRFDDAAVHLEAAARLAPRSARIHTLRGQAYLAQGNRKKAASAFRKALSLDPDDATARRGYTEATR